MFARLSIGIWLALLTVAAIVVVRARYVADMSAFLPHTPTSAQQMLVEQLQEGPASRLILMAIEGGDAPARERLSRAMTLRLKDDAQFLSIVNGEMADLERTQEFVFAHRYLLSDRIVPERLTVAGLRAAIEENLQLLSSPLGLMARGLFVRDPTGETLQVVSQLERSSRPSSLDGLWVSRNGQRALLVAQTRAAGSDTDGQQRAVDTLRRIFEQAQRADAKQTAGGASLRLAGPGVFAVQARDTIKREAVRLSILSALLIAALLLVAYRSLPVLLLGLLPVLSGAVAGVAAVALGFGVVHGITLGFGVTLIGESVDYSIYLLIQAYSERQRDKAAAWTRTLWPTIRLGLLASVCGFASLLPSTFPGLAQLGLYSIAGLVSAALVTRFVLPHLLVHDLALRSVAPLGQAFARTLPTLRALRVPILIIAVIGGLIVFFDRGQLWNAEISALSPIVAKDLALDGELRADLGAPDVRGMVLISAPDPDTVLQAAEHVSARLDSLVLAGDLAGFDSPSRYLPSLVTQETRRRLLPSAAEMRARLAVAVTPLPIRVDRLAPFLADLERARVMPLLQRSDLEHTALAGGYDALMTRHGQQWHGLLPLQAPTRGAGMPAIDIDRVRAAIDSAKIPAEVVVFDIKRESDALYAGYLSEAIRLSLAGFVAIWILLHIALRSVARVARVIVPLMLAVLLVMSGLALAGQALNILHLIGMLLVIAVGSNYALFFDRETSMADPAAAARTLASLLVANLATVIGFGVLAFSTVPVLAALGSTVAPGALLALLFSAAFAHRPQPTASTHGIR